MGALICNLFHVGWAGATKLWPFTPADPGDKASHDLRGEIEEGRYEALTAP